jgi:hypothetical protein
MKFGILKFFGTTMFGTKHTSVARMGSNQSLPSTALNLSSKADSLSWFIKLVDLLLGVPLAVKSTVIGV